MARCWSQLECSSCACEFQVVEVGFDVPGPGAQAQPWHRD